MVKKRGRWETRAMLLGLVCLQTLGGTANRAQAAEPWALTETRHAFNHGAVTLIYHRDSGEVAVDFGGCRIRVMELTSRRGQLIGAQPDDLPTSPFNVWEPSKVFVLDQQGLPRLELGKLLPPGLTRQELVDDLELTGEHCPETFLLVLAAPQS